MSLLENRVSCYTFDELSKEMLYDIMVLRQVVFVVEQDCPYLDADGKDQLSHHFVFYNDEKIVGYTRILEKGISYPDYGSIGRVVIHPDSRGQRLGYFLMKESVKKYYELFGDQPLKISAQEHLAHFYYVLGFRKIGESYLEDNIPHIAMIHKGQNHKVKEV